MPIRDIDTAAHHRDPEIRALDESILALTDAPKNLPALGLELLLLPADVRDDVVFDVHGADAGVPCAGERLLGDDADGVDGAEGGLDGGEGNHDTDDRAVGVADEETLREVVVTFLMREDVKVGEVDGGNDEGHERILTIVFGVGEDGEVSSEEGQLLGLTR